MKTILDDPGRLPMHLWAKDHASLLAYVQNRISFYHGRIDPFNLTINSNRHPGIKDFNYNWSTDWGVRARDETGEVVRYGLLDEIDILDDFEAAGLLVSPRFDLHATFTTRGREIAGALARYKSDPSHNYAGFHWRRFREATISGGDVS